MNTSTRSPTSPIRAAVRDLMFLFDGLDEAQRAAMLDAMEKLPPEAQTAVMRAARHVAMVVDLTPREQGGTDG